MNNPIGVLVMLGMALAPRIIKFLKQQQQNRPDIGRGGTSRPGSGYRGNPTDGASAPRNPAEQILDERLARGEIDTGQYNAARRALGLDSDEQPL